MKSFIKFTFLVVLLNGINLGIKAQFGWDPQLSNSFEKLSSTCFVDANTGWIAGDYGTILFTEDGGETWVAQSSNTTSALTSVFFISPSEG